MLAVLPNAPSLIHLGKNREALLAKRNRLLLKLLAAGVIDKETAVLAAAELLPEMPHELPHNAPHLLDRAYREHFAGNPYCVTRLRTTLVLELQQQLNAVLERYRAELKGNEVHNLAAIVLDTETGETLAYAGNVGNMEDKEHGAQVDCVNAARSTGSIMKPFLYGMMFDAGQLLPNELVSDVPTVIMGYRPENFSQTFDGSVGASKALSRSLNIPAVRLLNRYGVAKFHQNLRRWGVSTLTNPPEHYGLTLILGGAEAKLYDLVGIYASMGRTLQHFAGHSSRYDAADWHGASYQMAAAGTASPQLQTAAPFISAGAIWTAFTAMQAVERPNAEGAWEIYEGSRRVAWKTGTSWGGRDAWAIGVTPRYVVGVWIGNANGEGRPGVIGLTTAAPVLFDVFDLLPASSWWQQPYDDMRSVVVCHESGYRASLLCPHRDTIWAGQRGNEGVACPYHVLLHTDASGGWRVNANCEDVTAMRAVSWFILPPLEEQYFRLHHPEYTAPPPWRAGCVDTDASGGVRSPMQWLYPRNPTKIFVPIDLDGQLEQTVFQIAHRDPSMVVHWHLDSAYVGSTTVFHQFALRPSAGKHRLTLVDGAGVRLTQDIEVMVRK